MSDPFIGEIKFFSFDWAPDGWALCDGRLVAVSSNPALYSLLGNRFGGSANVNFALPDLRGRVALHYQSLMGQTGGTETVTLTAANIPSHTHQMFATSAAAAQTTPSTTNLFGAALQYNTDAPDTLLSSQTCSSEGGGQPHTNIQPSIVGNYCIATIGNYPQRP